MARGRGALQRELKQARPFRSRKEEGVAGIIRTADAVRRRLAAALGPFGLTPQQYNVLRILRGAGTDGLPTLEIAGRMAGESPGITRLLDRLEAKKLVRRERCPADRRQVLCWITAAALGLLERAAGPLEAAGEGLMGMLKGGEVARLCRLLDKVRAESP